MVAQGWASRMCRCGEAAGAQTSVATAPSDLRCGITTAVLGGRAWRRVQPPAGGPAQRRAPIWLRESW